MPHPSRSERAVSEAQAELTGRIRDRLLNALHVGGLRPGDRLPSIREVARETGVDHRMVASTYRTLQAEGLVQVRGRSGVYVADQERLGQNLLAETANWLAGVLTDAWKRQIPLPDLPELIHRCTAQSRIRVACVESTLDQITAYCTELTELFGLHCVPVYLKPEPDREELSRVQEVLHRVDFVVTTRYHSHSVHRAAQPLGKPVVVVTVHPDMVEAIRREIERGDLVVVAADPEFGNRLRAMYEGSLREGHGIRVLSPDDVEAIRELAPKGPILLTRAAAARLDGIAIPSALPHSPTISPQTARELSEVIIHLNLRTERMGA
ncbi:MAG TPA: GntR family transcriptional regulator, partial [Longimicrobiaceae bacterium]|nr:GntR family transcriptional regulator [Longimicrobiaceae bacterium]